jgi:hypothetical protein
MDTHGLLGLSALMSMVASIVDANLFVWPRLRIMGRRDALVTLVAPHMFPRSIGLSFLGPWCGLSVAIGSLHRACWLW